MASYRIIAGGITETSRLDEQRRFVPVKVIRYMVGDHGPFTYQIDAKDFTPERASSELEKTAQDVLKLLGS